MKEALNVASLCRQLSDAKNDEGYTLQPWLRRGVYRFLVSKNGLVQRFSALSDQFSP